MRKILLAAITATMTCMSMLAQAPGTGAYPFASFDNRGFDSINLGNNNIRFTIPIVNRRGRGPGFNYAIQYEGLVWQPVSYGSTTVWTPAPSWGFTGLLNGTAFAGYLTHSTNVNTDDCPVVNERSSSTQTFYDYVYHDAYGASHAFDYSYTTPCVGAGGGPTITGNGPATDGSGYILNNGQLETRNGILINPAYSSNGQDPASETDTNGNTISSNGTGSFTDTLGINALTISGSSPVTFSYPVARQANGATTASATLSYRSYTVRTNFQVSGVVEYGSNTVNLVDRLTLADGSFYAFGYESTPGATDGAVTARIASVTLPTGGIISYSYRFGWPGSIATDGTPAGLTRTTSDGSKQYNHDIDGFPATTSITIDEKGNETDYNFVGSTAGNNYETGRWMYQGAKQSGSVALLTRTTTYNGQAPTAELTASITQADVTTSYNGGSQSLVRNSFDASGNLLNSAQYNASTLLENTAYTYNQNSEPTSSVTTDGSNNTISSVTYGYDETTPTATSNIPQHVAVSGGIRGNQTSSQVSTGSGTLTTTTAYYDTGMPVSTTAPGGYTTTYGYDSTQTFLTSTAFPTPPSGVALSTSASYDTASAAILSATGLNSGQTGTVNQYDALLRPTNVSLPSGSTITYSMTPNQTNISQVLDTTSGQNTFTATLVDGYGRSSRTAVYNGQSSNPWYQVDSCYDPTGLLTFQSAPYQSTGFSSSIRCSGAGTSYQYDALSRVTNVSNSDGSSSTSYLNRAVQTASVNGVQRISQYDLLGRLTGVCENTSVAMGNDTPSACGMDIGGSGFITSYSYDLASHTTTINQGAQHRAFQTDAAGRSISVSEPERGQTNYSYVYNSTGLVVTRTRPQANQTSSAAVTHTTTQYDQIGRVVSITYDDNLTYPKHFYYDASWLDYGVSGVNAAGQLTAVTDTARTATAYGYDIAGNVNVIRECFHGFCGNHAYDMTYNYIYNAGGLPTSETYQSLAYTGTPVTNTYSYTLAGELQSITQAATHAGAAQNIPIYNATGFGPNGTGGYQTANSATTSVGYDALGRATASVSCLGGTPAQSGVSCASGQMIRGYSLTVQGSQVTKINDTIGGTDTPGYDSFGRLQSINWPSPGILMNWTYDRYGNRLSQTLASGSTASEPQPGYSYDPGTNHNTSFAYDAAGNVTTGGITYDAEGMAVGYGDGTVHVYDPLGHLVHEYISGGYNRLYAYGLNNRREAILDGSENMLSTQVYLGSQPLTYYTLANNTYTYQYQNQVGTEAARETSGQVTTFSSLPFGDAPGIAGAGQDTDAYHFAGMDTSQSSIPSQQTDTHHAQFRDYTSVSGQWLSPDPYDGSYDQTNPQSLNRYTYSLNNPLSFIDQNGLECGDPFDDDPLSQRGVRANECGGGGEPPDPCPVAACVTTDPPTPPPVGPNSPGPCDYGGCILSSSNPTVGPNVPSNPAPSKVGCGTVLPNGQTVGSVVRQQRAILQNAFNASAAQAQTGTPSNPLGYQLGAFTAIVGPNGRSISKRVKRDKPSSKWDLQGTLLTTPLELGSSAPQPWI